MKSYGDALLNTEAGGGQIDLFLPFPIKLPNKSTFLRKYLNKTHFLKPRALVDLINQRLGLGLLTFFPFKQLLIAREEAIFLSSTLLS